MRSTPTMLCVALLFAGCASRRPSTLVAKADISAHPVSTRPVPAPTAPGPRQRPKAGEEPERRVVPGSTPRPPPPVAPSRTPPVPYQPAPFKLTPVPQDDCGEGT